MSSRLYWQQMQQAYRARSIVWLVSALLLFTLLWAFFAKLDEVVVGEGKVVPAQAVQKIQSLEGGILKQLFVSEGQLVEAGDPLAKLDDTRFRSAYQEAQQQNSSLNARRLRLIAELASIVIDKEATDWRQRIRIIEQPLVDQSVSPVILANASASYRERIEQLQAQLEQSRQNIEQQVQALDEVRGDTRTLAHNLELVTEEVELTRDVVASGAVAKVELLKLQRELSSLKGELAASRISEQRLIAARDQAVAEYRNTARDFRSKAQVELVDTDNQLAQLFERSTQLKDQLSRTQLISPVRGNVKNMVTRSVGGVIKPGEAMMEVVPLDDQLLVETRIAPQDIAFVHKGLPATVKLTAYDFVIYGGVKGEVVYVSADAQQDQEGVTYYEAHIQTQQQALQAMPMIPGMQASVDVLTGQKTVLNYWLKPLLRARANAMREP
ncbi:HlyD family type I secretion periplasmic adaptor subunit [Oceanicoccus sagamiensis]|uniref:Membrane fusion protein (MFP) family protein n=1 Tax=Oceanicoccus sagamiensis TaxID=716816 RepID=A0A1X9NJV3_9GAMM|nr:HlyD family type I secretion periplasmic adaptor subunit [Oceanicoccus sagamiensis]ARN75147.1 hypothetical protein BST96_14100 [Oceanicoccus sagamiensis]